MMLPLAESLIADATTRLVQPKMKLTLISLLIAAILGLAHSANWPRDRAVGKFE